MLTFFGLIPSVPLLELDYLASRFSSEHADRYTFQNLQKTNDCLSCDLLFTDKKVQEFKEVWESRRGNVLGLDAIIGELKKLHHLKIYPCGIMRMDIDEPKTEDIEFVQDEMRDVYNDILKDFITIQRTIGYTISPEEIGMGSMTSAIRQDATLDLLAEEIDDTIYRLQETGAETASSDLKKTLNDIETKWAALIRRAGYKVLLGTFDRLSKCKTLASLMGIVTSRIVEHVAKRNAGKWKRLVDECETLVEYFSSIMGSLRFVLDTYSDHLGTVGIYINIVVLGLGLIVPSLTPAIDYSSGSAIVVGVTSLFIGALLWRLTGSKELLVSGLKEVQLNLEATAGKLI